MGETSGEVINSMSKLLRSSKTIGMSINEEKTKYIMLARKGSAIDYILVDDYRFKKVEVFKYLEINIHNNINMHDEINDRIACDNL